ncbi:MAG TPA: type II toxin-antitoxin system HicA family toxin [Candidatus Omnitrophota bacterium]|nr:type II toxin-antitoxin system HicA family toxin [Candidatus Omnitrophota bacterium]
MNGNELIRILTDHGWKLDRIKGSHHILVKEGARSIPVPVHGSKDLPPGLVHAVLKQAGVKKRAKP